MGILPLPLLEKTMSGTQQHVNFLVNTWILCQLKHDDDCYKHAGANFMYVNFYLQNMLAKLLIEVLCLGKDSPDALRLLHYKAPKTARAVSGNFF